MNYVEKDTETPAIKQFVRRVGGEEIFPENRRAGALFRASRIVASNDHEKFLGGRRDTPFYSAYYRDCALAMRPTARHGRFFHFILFLFFRL